MSETPAPVMVPLAEPRELTAAERALLEALVDHTGHTDLREQARRAVVTDMCSCGCPSVGLGTEGPALSTEDMLAFSGLGRDDWFGIRATEGGTDVVVHVINGRIEELEIYGGVTPETVTDVEMY